METNDDDDADDIEKFDDFEMQVDERCAVFLDNYLLFKRT